MASFLDQVKELGLAFSNQENTKKNTSNDSSWSLNQKPQVEIKKQEEVKTPQVNQAQNNVKINNKKRDEIENRLNTDVASVIAAFKSGGKIPRNIITKMRDKRVIMAVAKIARNNHEIGRIVNNSLVKSPLTRKLFQMSVKQMSVTQKREMRENLSGPSVAKKDGAIASLAIGSDAKRVVNVAHPMRRQNLAPTRLNLRANVGSSRVALNYNQVNFRNNTSLKTNDNLIQSKSKEQEIKTPDYYYHVDNQTGQKKEKLYNIKGVEYPASKISDVIKSMSLEEINSLRGDEIPPEFVQEIKVEQFKEEREEAVLKETKHDDFVEEKEEKEKQNVPDDVFQNHEEDQVHKTDLANAESKQALKEVIDSILGNEEEGKEVDENDLDVDKEEGDSVLENEAAPVVKKDDNDLDDLAEFADEIGEAIHDEPVSVSEEKIDKKKYLTAVEEIGMEMALSNEEVASGGFVENNTSRSQKSFGI